ncbi:MAG: hypothetical protein HY22_10165 [[Candidatus Thermochlorobacteriaceae] bacterium GBChlB]|nr:MAG: hypothetical protein HY22_10165 [[Candidatus Thermochlorobacteriaceae] bacterium GBChlB]
MKSPKLSNKIFSVHSWLGLISGAFLIVIGLTGSILALTDELHAWLNPDLMRVEPQAKTVSLDQMLANVKAKFPDAKVFGIQQGETPDESYRVRMDLNNEFYYAQINPYSGDVLGCGDLKPRNSYFVYFSRVMHYSLLMRPVGDLMVALIGLMFILLTLTGLYVNRKSLVRVFRVGVRWEKGVQKASSDAHQWIGVASLAFTFVMSATGFYLMLYAFSPEFYTRITEKSNPPAVVLSADSLMAQAKLHLPDFTPVMLQLPRKENQPITVRGHIAGSLFLYNHYSSYVQFDSKTGAVKKTFNINGAGFGEQLHAWLVALHYGQFGGFWLKLIYCIGGLTPGILSVTGFVIWWKKKRRQVAPMQKTLPTKSAYSSASSDAAVLMNNNQ